MRLIATVVGPLAQLSPRERQVGRLLAHGATSKMIAYKLHITESTVKGHITHMKGKLELANRVQLCAWIILHPACVAGLAVDTAVALPFKDVA